MKRFEKTILVTGGAGFIGSNYLNYAVLKYPSYLFVNVDVLSYAADKKHITVARESNYVFEKKDICDSKKIENLFKKYRPTDIIHFAAESHVDVSIKNPDIFIQTNIVGTHNLLVLAKRYSIKRFLFVSTDEVYGSLAPDSPSSKEEDTLSPNSPYSASKAAAEMLVRAYHHTFRLDTIVTRSSNNYGPHQHKEKFIPLFISELAANRKAPLYGTGKNIRNWIYVDDNVEGIDRAFHKGISGETYNFGGTSELENIVVAYMICDSLKKKRDLVQPVTDRLGHDFRYSLDSSKARTELGWTPRVSFEEGLQKTIEHYTN